MVSKPTEKKTKTASSKRSATKAAAKPAKARAPKRSTTKAAITKPVAAAKAAPAMKLVTPVDSAPDNDEINKRELVERVSLQSGMKKGDARRAVDAVLGALNGVISEGKDLAAAPLGKIKLVRKKQTPNGELAVLRVKLKDPNKAPKPKPEADDAAAS